jgi:SAM-dependent methyltransferase
MWGIDAVPENVAVAHAWHPEIRDRVIIHDLRKPLPFNNAFFDFVLCNAVIQHIEPDLVHNVVLPELMRVLRTNGVLQLMFKDGEGTATVFDKDFGTERCFQLYRHDIVLKTMAEDRMEVIGNGKNKLGGIMRFVDPKGSRHCVFYLRKTGNGSLAAYKNAPKLS